MASHTTTAQKKQYYLILYNLTSAILWTAILGRLLLLIPLVGVENVYGGLGEFTKWTQTLALLEIVHSATGAYHRFFFFVEETFSLWKLGMH